MIIFGWGRRIVRIIGPVHQVHCSHCNNEPYFNLKTISTWLTLFFIPVIPYEFKRYLVCPICNYGRILDKAQFESYRQIAEANKAFMDKKISKEEYDQKINSLQPEQAQTAAGQDQKG